MKGRRKPKPKKRKRTLDKRPTRHDRLTSRECCSLLGAALEGLLMIWSPDILQEVVRYIAANKTGWKLRTALWKMNSDSEMLKRTDMADQERTELHEWHAKLTAAGIDNELLEQHALAMLVLNPYIGGLCNISTIKNVKIAVEWWTNDDVWTMFQQKAKA